MKVRCFVFLVSVLLLVPSTANADLMGVVVNELLADPNSASNNFDTDGDGTAETSDEFIELLNTGGASVDISGWEIYVGSGGVLSVRHTFAAGTVLSPGELLVGVNEWDPGAVPAGFVELDAGGGGIFGNGGDNITLYDPNNNNYISYVYNGDPDLVGNGMPAGATRVGDVIDMGNDVDGLSISALPDGSTTWGVQGPTPGELNASIPEPGTAVLLAFCGIAGLLVRKRK